MLARLADIHKARLWIFEYFQKLSRKDAYKGVHESALFRKGGKYVCNKNKKCVGVNRTNTLGEIEQSGSGGSGTGLSEIRKP
jgi:hypothetical protein